MRTDCAFYICPVCFQTNMDGGRHHGHDMVYCRQLPIGDELLKPIVDSGGDLKSRAPRWFLEAVWEAAGIDFLDE
jgi:hypothetical protein